MTAFSKVSIGRFSRQYNKKDGGSRHFARATGFWGMENFMPVAPGEWSYTWREAINCPVFKVTENDYGQIVATLEGGEITMAFVSHTETKKWLDDQILEIMRLQADTADPVASDSIPFAGEPATVEGQEIGPEIDFDAWMVAE